MFIIKNVNNNYRGVTIFVTPHFLPIIGTDLQRTKSGGRAEVNIRHEGIVMSRLHFCFQKKSFQKNRHSSPSASQHSNAQHITKVIQPLSLVTQLITQT